MKSPAHAVAVSGKGGGWEGPHERSHGGRVFAAWDDESTAQLSWRRTDSNLYILPSISLVERAMCDFF